MRNKKNNKINNPEEKFIQFIKEHPKVLQSEPAGVSAPYIKLIMEQALKENCKIRIIDIGPPENYKRKKQVRRKIK